MGESVEEAAFIDVYSLNHDISVASPTRSCHDIFVEGKGDEDDDGEQIDGRADSAHAFGYLSATRLAEVASLEASLDEGSLGAVFTHTLDGVLLSLNSYGAESLGYSVDEMIGHRLSHFMSREAQQSFDDPSEWRPCKLTLRRHIVSVGHILLGQGKQ